MKSNYMKCSFILSNDILKNILDFDGRFKFIDNKFVGIIHKDDYRYKIVNRIINFWKSELKDCVHPYTDKTRWMVVIAPPTPLSYEHTLPIGLNIYSNWRFPGERRHEWYNYSFFNSQSYRDGKDKFVRFVNMPKYVNDNAIIIKSKHSEN